MITVIIIFKAAQMLESNASRPEGCAGCAAGSCQVIGDGCSKEIIPCAGGLIHTVSYTCRGNSTILQY